MRTSRGRDGCELLLGDGGPDPHEVRDAILAVAHAAGIQFPEQHWLHRTLALSNGLRTDAAGADVVRAAALGSVWYLDREPEADDTTFVLSARVEVDGAMDPADRAAQAAARGEDHLAALAALGTLDRISRDKVRTIRD